MESLTLREIDSSNELQEILRKSVGHLIGDDKSANHNYLINYPSSTGTKQLGLSAMSSGIKPTAFIDRDSDCIIVLHGSTLSRINISNPRNVIDCDLTTPIYEILRVNPDHSLVVLHELGMVKLTREGQILWATTTSDIVEEHTIAGNDVELALADGTDIKISILTGKISD